MTADAQIRELQQIVLEKDDLLKVLTERLELAAEQLDRLRRQGSMIEPSHHLTEAPKSPQIDSPAVLQDLKQMLADWHDLQSRDWFGTLEERLDGIHDVVTHLRLAPPPARTEEKSSPSSVAEILAKYQTAERSHSETETSVRETPLESTESVEEVATKLELPELPPPVDIDAGSTEELRTALRQREEYILRLRDYLQSYDELESNPISGVDLGTLTPEQTATVEAWEAKVRKELRQTQIQLWVERAQLSREQMQLQQKVHHLETETRKLGLAKKNAGAGGTGENSGDSAKGKNWMGLFGGK